MVNEEEVRFNIMKGWAVEKGALGLENVVFPTSYHDEFSPADKEFAVTGVAAHRDIGHRESIIAIPFDCLISPKTFKDEEPELYAYVVEECPDLFDEAEQPDAE